MRREGVVNKRTLTMTAIAAVMLVASTAISLTTTEDAFANTRNQAKSETSRCGNGFMPTNVGCQNIDSQIQGDRNAVALSAQQRFPVSGLTCEECFSNFLTADEIALFERVLTDLTEGEEEISTIAELCTFLEGLTPGELSEIIDFLEFVLTRITDDPDRAGQVADCLRDVFDVA
jgi:hypothetical protein